LPLLPGQLEKLTLKSSVILSEGAVLRTADFIE